jgi:hypothetical protein
MFPLRDSTFAKIFQLIVRLFAIAAVVLSCASAGFAQQPCDIGQCPRLPDCDFSGTWQGFITLDLKQSGAALTGTVAGGNVAVTGSIIDVFNPSPTGPPTIQLQIGSISAEFGISDCNHWVQGEDSTGQHNLTLTKIVTGTCSSSGVQIGSVNLGGSCTFSFFSTPQWTRPFGDGSMLDLTCQYPSNVTGLFHLPAYMLWYTNPQGQRSRIAQCLFSGGINSGSYRVGQDAQQNSCLISTDWESIDGGANDAIPLVAAGFAGNQNVFVTNQEPYLDVERFHYDTGTDKLSWRNEKYRYPNNTQTCDQTCAGRVGASLFPIPGLGVSVDPLVGPETEQLFDSLWQQLQNVPFEPMQFLAGCDLNADGVCDAIDQSLLSRALGTCSSQPGYIQRADVDGDGCITATDVAAVQALFTEYRAGCTRSRQYWKNHASRWPTTSLAIGGQTYNKDQLLQILMQPAHGNGAVALAKQIITAKLNISSGASPVVAPVGTGDGLIFNFAPGLLPPFGNASLSNAIVNPYVHRLRQYNNGELGPPACRNNERDDERDDEEDNE